MFPPEPFELEGLDVFRFFFEHNSIPKRGRTKYYLFWYIIISSSIQCVPERGRADPPFVRFTYTHTRTTSQNSPEELTGQRAGLVSSRNNESIK